MGGDRLPASGCRCRGDRAQGLPQVRTVPGPDTGKIKGRKERREVGKMDGGRKEGSEVGDREQAKPPRSRQMRGVRARAL